MTEVHIIGLDLAKRVFQAHGASSDGTVLFRKKLSRNQVLAFLSSQPHCIVAIANVYRERQALTQGGVRQCSPLGM